MSDLVLIKKQELVTTSKIIAERTDNSHESIQKLIRTYDKPLNIFGKVGFKIRPLDSGQTEKIYFLNEQQTTLLVTL